VRPDFSPWRWREQLVVWLLLVSLLAVVGVVIRTFLDYRAAAIDLLITRDQQLTYLSAARLRDELFKFADSLTTLARTQEIYDGDPAAQSKALAQAMPIAEGLFDGGVILLDNFGKVIAAEPELDELVGEDWSDHESFRRMLSSRSTYFSDATEDLLNGSLVVIVSVPVIGEGGQFLGVLSGTLRLGQSTISPFYATIVRLRVGQSGGSIYVLDSNGTILFDSVSDKVGQRYASAVLSDIVLARQPGAARTRNSEQREVIASFAPIPGTAWTLVVEDDWNTLTAETQQYIRLLIFLLALGLLLLATGAILLIYQRHNEVTGSELAEDSMEVAHQLKQLLLPESPPMLPGWSLSTHYQSLPAVEGDFYDLMLLRDGRLMVTVGDILTNGEIDDQGIPVTVALMTTRATLRGAARLMLAPDQALEHSNEFLCPELPQEINVTCIFALLDPSTGKLQYANAGHQLPVYHNGAGIAPLQATGTPLGLQLGSTYRENEISIAPGEWILFYNNELTEVRNTEGEPFGQARLNDILNQQYEGGDEIIEAILTAIQNFADESSKADTGALVVVERLVPNGVK
jgi:serine phosphatase RsbU (regulator of sigma subunit)